MSKESKLVKNTLILIIGVFVPKFLSLVTLPIITSSLSEEEFGLYDVMSTWIVVFLPIISLKLDSALFRMLIENRDDKIKSQQTIANVIYPVLVLVVIWFVIISLFFPRKYINYKFIFYAWLFSQIIYDLLMQMLRGFSKNKLYTFMSSFSSIANSILVIFFIYFKNKGLYGLLISTITGLQVVVICIIIIYNKTLFVSPKFLQKKIIKTNLEYSLGLIPNALCSWIVSLSDRLIINFFLSLQFNAIYSVANKLPSLLVLVQSTFATAWSESASLNINETDKKSFFTNMFEKSSSFSAGVTCIALAFTPMFFNIFIRGNYNDAIIHNNIILIGIYCLSITWFLGGIFLAYKETKQVAKIAILSALINIIINLGLIKFIGLFAASLSTTIAYFVTMLQRVIYTQKKGWIIVKWKNFIICFSLVLCVFIMELLFKGFVMNCIICFFSIVVFCILNKSVIESLLYKIFKNSKMKM